MFRTFAEFGAIVVFLALCIGLQYHWYRRSRAGAIENRGNPELSDLGVVASARVAPLLKPRAIGHLSVVGKTDARPAAETCAAPWTRSFFEKVSKSDSTRWLRLTLTPQGKSLRRQVVLMRREKTKRVREVTFELPAVDAVVSTSEQIAAIVDASFAAARKQLAPAPTAPAASRVAPAANQPLASIPNVRRIRKDVVGGVLENFGHDKRKFGDKPEFSDYFVDIKQTDGTVERIWGSALQDEVKRTSAQRGDHVVVTFLGRKAVEVGEGGSKRDVQKKLYQIEFAAPRAVA